VDRADYDEFSRAIRGANHEVDLFGAAMLVARLGGSAAPPHEVARRLDAMAERVRDYAGEYPSAEALAHAIDFELFTRSGFRGNTEAYTDPRNSYLDQVVERGLGIPITLSLVYMEVAARAGLECDGIGYPGHFIVRYGYPESPVYVDPFQQGARLDREELIARLRAQDFSAANPEACLSAVTRRQMLQRMLYNLRAIFRQSRDLERWHATLELLLRIEPWNASLTGERGMLNYRLGHVESAMADLEAYISAADHLAVSPGAVRLLDQLRLRYGEMGEPR